MEETDEFHGVRAAGAEPPPAGDGVGDAKGEGAAFGVRIENLTVRYGSKAAVAGVTTEFSSGDVCGLLGRNASGKTTLLSVIAAFRRPSRGRVLVDGEDPFENPRIMAGTCLIREGGDLIDDASVRTAVQMAADLRPEWDWELALRLLDRFEVPLGSSVKSLSRGRRSALGVTIGLASRTPLTMFDETYLGMDAPARHAFYGELRREHGRRGRTFILSSHLISEVDRLLEHVTIIDRGRLLLADTREHLRNRALMVSGTPSEVDEFSREQRIVSSRTGQGTKQVTLLGRFSEHDRARARELGLDLQPVPLQDLVVRLSTGEEGD